MVCSDSTREIAKSEKLINFSTPFDVLFQENNIHDYHPLIKFIIIIIIIKTFLPKCFSGCTGFTTHYTSNVIKELVQAFSCVLLSYTALGNWRAFNKVHEELLSDIALSNSDLCFSCALQTSPMHHNMIKGRHELVIVKNDGICHLTCLQ